MITITQISSIFPLSGHWQYAAAALAGMVIGVIAVRSSLCSAQAVKDSLCLRNGDILKLLLCAMLTAVIASAFLMKIHPVSLTQNPGFRQNLLGGAAAGIGLFLAGRSFFTALAALGCGKLHALWFLLGAGGTLFFFEGSDCAAAEKILSYLKRGDFSTGRLSSPYGWEFFDLRTPGVWVAITLAVLLLLVCAAFFRMQNTPEQK